MKVVKGDLIQMALDGQFSIIVHGCNCQNVMGKGIAKSIKETFPAAYEADLKTIKGDKSKLGKFSWTPIQIQPHPTNIDNSTVYVVNAYTQYDYRGEGVLVDYDAVRSCFGKLRSIASREDTIGYPKLGAGLAKGDWMIISRIIDEELDGYNHTLVEWNK